MGFLRVYLIVIIIVFNIGNCISVGAENKETNGVESEISFEENTYDFGKVYMGEIVKHVYKFKNLGEGDLVIDSVKTACGCTAALVSKNKLKKNEEGQVEVKYNPGKYVGKVTKSVIVNSNDPKNKKIKLTIQGEIIEEVNVNPKRINFGIIRKGESFSQEITIKTVGDIKILKVESPNPCISIARKSTGENNELKYSITIDKYDYIGKFDGIVFVYTGSSKQERIDVPFYGEIVGDVTFYPEIVSFGTFRKEQELKKSIIINFVNKEVKIGKIEIEPHNFSYVISEFNTTSKKVDIVLRDKNITGIIAGNVRIYTNSSIQPVINITIKGEVKD
jgi:hypothetical protein